MIEFRLSKHFIRDVNVVEVWYNNQFIATICPPPPYDNRAAITVISKHIDAAGVVVDNTDPVEPPVVMIPFKGMANNN
jgi:hypothetical protein